MKKYINGKYIEMTAEEVTEIKAEAVKFSLMEKSRPLTEAEVIKMLITQQINTLAVDDNTALRMTKFYPEWAAGKSYGLGYKVQRNGLLWRCRQAHTAITTMEPENAASLWKHINETHSGTADDPIPYDGNMALINGLYYTQGGVLYLCIRDTVNPVYNNLTELVGLYVEVAA